MRTLEHGILQAQFWLSFSHGPEFGTAQTDEEDRKQTDEMVNFGQMTRKKLMDYYRDEENNTINPGLPIFKYRAAKILDIEVLLKNYGGFLRQKIPTQGKNV